MAFLVVLESMTPAERVAFILHRVPGNTTFLERTVNGQPGLVAEQDGITVTVFAFDVAGDRIRDIWVVRNAEKLRCWTTRPDRARADCRRRRGMWGRSIDIGAGFRKDSAIMGYHKEVHMADMLIRNVPDDVIAALDARAGRLGLSRSEYVRRRLAQDAAAGDAAVSTGDLTRFAGLFSDLADPEVMSQAWR